MFGSGVQVGALIGKFRLGSFRVESLAIASEVLGFGFLRFQLPLFVVRGLVGCLWGLILLTYF